MMLQAPFYQAMLNASEDAIFLLDSSNHFVYVNDAACKALHYTSQELCSMSIFDIDLMLTAEDLKQYRAQAQYDQGDRKHFQTKHLSKSSQIIDIDALVSGISLEGCEYAIYIAKDITSSKRIEHERTLLKFAFDENHEASFLIEDSGRFWYVNEAICTMLGYSQEELLGMHVSEINPAITEDSWPAHWSALKKIGGLTFEGSSRCKDGKVIPVEITTNYFEFNGKAYNIGIIKDITYRHKMQVALLNREQEFHSLAENLPDSISRWDKKQRFIFANQQLSDSLGLPVEQMMGNSLKTLFPDGCLSDLEAVIKKVVETQEPCTLHKLSCLSHGDEQRVDDLSLVPEFDSHGELISVLGIARNMTEYYRLQQEIEAKEQQLRVMIETLPGAVGIFHLKSDQSSSIPYMSASSLEILGVDHKAIMQDASRALSLIHEEDRQHIYRTMRHSLENMTPWCEEYRINHPDKNECWIESHATPLPHPEDGVMWFGFLQDITARKRYEKQIGLASIGQLSAGITHEINTPLTYIKGRLELMQLDINEMEEGKLKNELLDDLSSIQGGIIRMSRIIQSMREIAGRNKGIKEQVNIYESFIVTLIMIHNRAKYISPIYLNGELFTHDINNTEEAFNCFVEKQRIEQVWIIILNNALDVLEYKQSFDESRIDITIKNLDDEIFIKIEDNGGGVQPDLLPDIFEPFTSTKVYGGMGLGLNIAQRIIDEQCGTINIYNGSSGATLDILLPKADRHHPVGGDKY